MVSTVIAKAKYQRHKDGGRWVCPHCGAKLAHVCQVDYGYDVESNVKQGAGLELRAGYVWNEGRDVWLIPANRLKGMKGQRNRGKRQMETARFGNSRMDMIASERALPVSLRPAQLPMMIVCPTLECAQQLEIPSVRSLTTTW